MPSRSKISGYRFEREMVLWFQERGYEAERAYGSNGKALGEAKEVDLRVVSDEGSSRIQAKYRTKIAKYLEIPEGCDCVVFRRARGRKLVLKYAEDEWPELQDP